MIYKKEFEIKCKPVQIPTVLFQNFLLGFPEEMPLLWISSLTEQRNV